MSTRVAVELMPWVPRLIGRDEHKHAFLEYDCQAGETVRQLLTRMAGDYPRLGDMLLDRQKGELNFPIEVAVNGSVLGIHHTLDSELQSGDALLLLPQYQGG